MKLNSQEKILLPKGYLSHSAITLWEKNPDRYRQQYYYGLGWVSSPELRFGSKIHKLLEDNHASVKHVPRYDFPEMKIDIWIEGIPIRAFIDSLDTKTHKFIDYKTGQLTKAGNPPWNTLKVRKHDQLPFYATLIDEYYNLNPKDESHAALVWLETEKEGKIEVKRGGMTLRNKGTLNLTGRVEVYNRVIAPYEKQLQRERIVRVAHEISRDYIKHINMI